MHALGLVPAVDMDPLVLTQRPADATSSLMMPPHPAGSGRLKMREEQAS